MNNPPTDYITYARHLSSNGCFSKSFDTYLIAFERDPLSKDHYEPEFRLLLTRLNEVLELSGKMEDIFRNFELAFGAFPDNIYMLNDVGKYLYKLTYYDEAWGHFSKALAIDSGFVNAEKNLDSIKNLLVERWHFRMLNDKIRNEAYHNAIQQTLIPHKDSVLDIGCGTGLLSIYACEKSPLVISACDASDTMTKLSNLILEENGLTNVAVLHTMSTSMTYSDLGGRRTLIVTELFDSGLFGENILQTLIHAWENLITPDGRVLPNSAEFFIVGAKCDRLNKKFQLCESAKSMLNISDFYVHIYAGYEKYDCEDVSSYKDIKYVTENETVVKINFNDYNDLQDKLTREEPFNINLKGKEDEDMNLLIGWFNIHLTDEITITTDPQSEGRANAWQQAIFFDFVPLHIKENQSTNINMSIIDGKLSLESNYQILRASSEVIRFLNDTVFVDIITQSIPMVSVYLSQISEITELDIVDLCPFPLFGLYMMKREAKSLKCYAKTTEDKQFIEQVFKINHVPLSKVTILEGEELSVEVFGDEKYHAIFCNIFDLCGDIDIKLKQLSNILYNTHLFQGGLFMPRNITVIGQLIESKWIDINNQVFDENVSYYKVAVYMNNYMVTQNFNLDLTNLEFTPLSDTHTIGTIEYRNIMTPQVLNIPITRDGNCNAILCWYKIEMLEDMGEFTTNRNDCFIDGMAFLPNPKLPMRSGDIGNILRCVDPDGAFKLMLDVEEQ